MLRQISVGMDTGSSCVFGHITDRVHASGRSFMKAALDSDVAGDRRQSNSQIYDFFLENKKWLITRDSTSWCYQHGCECPVFPQAAMHRARQGQPFTLPAATSSRQFGEGVHAWKFPRVGYQPWWASLPSSSCSSARASPSASSSSTSGWAAASSKASSMTFEEPEDTNNNPLFFSVAGLVCTEWSTAGKQQCGGGDTDAFHSVWCCDRLAAAEGDVEDVEF